MLHLLALALLASPDAPVDEPPADPGPADETRRGAGPLSEVGLMVRPPEEGLVAGSSFGMALSVTSAAPEPYLLTIDHDTVTVEAVDAEGLTRPLRPQWSTSRIEIPPGGAAAVFATLTLPDPGTYTLKVEVAPEDDPATHREASATLELQAP